MAQSGDKLQVDGAHLHHDDLLQVLVLQDWPEHGVRLLELQADGRPAVVLLPPLRVLPLLVLGLRVNAVGGDVDRPLRVVAGVVAVRHAAVHDLLDLDVHAMHLGTAPARLVRGLDIVGRPQARHGVDAIGGEVHRHDIHPCGAQQNGGLVERDLLVEEAPIQQADRQRIEEHIPSEGDTLDLERNLRGRQDGATDDDKQVEDLGAHNHTNTRIGTRIQGDQVREELGAIAAQGADRGSGDRLLAPTLRALVRALPHLLYEHVDCRDEVRVTDVMLREEHEGDNNKPQASDG
mmetsp:Transcript_72704/g.210501  ORF Transcript_72704/g.210501 Transcript_72704/m.210501 type:complete len:292 (-) Transcript_72704:93-968(-)